MLGHLNVRDAASIRDTLYEGGFVVAWQLKDLSSSSVPDKHSFELSDYSPISFPVRRMPPTHNEVIKKEIEDMLKARVISQAYSPWRFSVMIAEKWDRRPRFFINYHALNRRMKADRFSIPNIE